MKEPYEVRICLRQRKDGRVEISTWNPHNRKEIRTGMKAGPGQDAIDRAVVGLKHQLEASGNRVSVVNLG